jgi:hypothetical protein
LLRSSPFTAHPHPQLRLCWIDVEISATRIATP